VVCTFDGGPRNKLTEKKEETDSKHEAMGFLRDVFLNRHIPICSAHIFYCFELASAFYKRRVIII